MVEIKIAFRRARNVAGLHSLFMLMVLVGQALLAQQPDLVPQSVTVSSTAIGLNGDLTVNVTVANQGPGSAASTTTMVRLSTNPNSSSLADLQVPVFTPSLAPGASRIVSGTFYNLSTPGTYY